MLRILVMTTLLVAPTLAAAQDICEPTLVVMPEMIETSPPTECVAVEFRDGICSEPAELLLVNGCDTELGNFVFDSNPVGALICVEDLESPDDKTSCSSVAPGVAVSFALPPASTSRTLPIQFDLDQIGHVMTVTYATSFQSDEPIDDVELEESCSSTRTNPRMISIAFVLIAMALRRRLSVTGGTSWLVPDAHRA